MYISARKVFVALLILCVISDRAYAWDLFGPKNYEDCVLDGVKNAKTNKAVAVVVQACANKFPRKSPAGSPLPTYDPPDYNLFSSFGMFRPTLNQLITKIEVNALNVVQTGNKLYGVKSYDHGHHLSLEVTNRNEFPIVGLEIGVPKRKNGLCSWDDKDFSEIHRCDGNAGARNSGSFVCKIPRLESRRVEVCITGFFMYANNADVEEFKRKYSIPSRLK